MIVSFLPSPPIFFCSKKTFRPEIFIFPPVCSFFNNPSIPQYWKRRTGIHSWNSYWTLFWTCAKCFSLCVACAPLPTLACFRIYSILVYLRPRYPLLITAWTSVFRPVDKEQDGINGRVSPPNNSQRFATVFSFANQWIYYSTLYR